MSADKKNQVATLGGGCFWCLEPVYEDLKGIEDVTVGYAGGHTENPSYEQVSTGRTGHAEVVQIKFNPDVITFRDILEVFFSIHDPTTPNRQGADVGSQYRSIILYNDQQQKEVAEQVIEELNQEGVWNKPIVTELKPFETYYKAEEYHQEYYQKNPYAGYCQVVIRPKLGKFKKKYEERLKTAA